MEPGQSPAPRCDNCGAEISWQPVSHRGGRYCCGGCAQGGPCYCSYDVSTAPIGATAELARPLARRGGLATAPVKEEPW